MRNRSLGSKWRAWGSNGFPRGTSCYTYAFSIYFPRYQP